MPEAASGFSNSRAGGARRGAWRLAGGGSCEAWAASSPTGRCLPNSNVEDQAVLHPDKTLHDMGRRNGGSADAGPYAYACSAWGNCATPSTECNPLAHCVNQ
eukprot:COSAG04_NODE_6373_length_1344_cov_0.856225_2_plen_102_part_01